MRQEKVEGARTEAEAAGGTEPGLSLLGEDPELSPARSSTGPSTPFDRSQPSRPGPEDVRKV